MRPTAQIPRWNLAFNSFSACTQTTAPRCSLVDSCRIYFSRPVINPREQVILSVISIDRWRLFNLQDGATVINFLLVRLELALRVIRLAGSKVLPRACYWHGEFALERAIFVVARNSMRYCHRVWSSSFILTENYSKYYRENGLRYNVINRLRIFHANSCFCNCKYRGESLK